MSMQNIFLIIIFIVVVILLFTFLYKNFVLNNSSSGGNNSVSSNEDSSQAIAKAQSAYEMGQLSKAIKILEEFIKKIQMKLMQGFFWGIIILKKVFLIKRKNNLITY